MATLGAQQHHDRRWLDEAPARSMASVMAVAEQGYGSIAVSDGHASVTLDFFYSTPEEYEHTVRKIAALQSVVSALSSHIRLSQSADKVSDDSRVLTRITP